MTPSMFSVVVLAVWAVTAYLAVELWDALCYWRRRALEPRPRRLSPGFIAQKERVRAGKAPRAPDGKILPGKSGCDPDASALLDHANKGGWA